MVGYLEIIDDKWMVRGSEMSAYPIYPDDVMIMDYRGDSEIGKRVQFDLVEVHPITYAKIKR